MPLIEITEEQFEFLAQIQNLLNTQDNRMTSNPVFGVVSYPNKRTGRGEFVTACLTESGCNHFLHLDGHNHRRASIYVYSGYRNTEWEKVREFFKTAKLHPQSK